MQWCSRAEKKHPEQIAMLETVRKQLEAIRPLPENRYVAPSTLSACLIASSCPSKTQLKLP